MPGRPCLEGRASCCTIAFSGSCQAPLVTRRGCRPAARTSNERRLDSGDIWSRQGGGEPDPRDWFDRDLDWAGVGSCESEAPLCTNRVGGSRDQGPGACPGGFGTCGNVRLHPKGRTTDPSCRSLSKTNYRVCILSNLLSRPMREAGIHRYSAVGLCAAAWKGLVTAA